MDAATTRLTPTTGHIHLSLDGSLMSMTYGLVQQISLQGVAPGRHMLQAEFVAADHGPFSPRVVADVRSRHPRAPRHDAPLAPHARPGPRRGGRRPLRPVRLGARRTRILRSRVGRQLSSAPAQVVMNFTEEPDLSLSVVSPEHRRRERRGRSGGGRRHPKQLVSPLPANLGDGSYTVSWRVVSPRTGTSRSAPSPSEWAAPRPRSTAGPPRPRRRPVTSGLAGKVLLYAGLAPSGLPRRACAHSVATCPRAGGLLPSRARHPRGDADVAVAERASIGVSFATLLRARAGSRSSGSWRGRRSAVASVVASRTPPALPRRPGGGGRRHDARAGRRRPRRRPGMGLGPGHVAMDPFPRRGHLVGGLVPVLLRLRERAGQANDAGLDPEVRRYSTMAGIALGPVSSRARCAPSARSGVSAPSPASAPPMAPYSRSRSRWSSSWSRWAPEPLPSIPRLEAGDPSQAPRDAMEVVGAIGLFALTGP